MNRKTRFSIWLCAIVALLIMVRAALPYVVTEQLNTRLASMGSYRGHVEGVDLHLWHGGYTIRQLKIEKVDGKVPVPLLDAPQTELLVAWGALVRGRVVASIEFDRPVLNFVDGRRDTDDQTGRGVNWRQQLEKLTPINLDEVRVVDGQLIFHNFLSNPPVDLRVTAVNGNARNLTNVEDENGARVATFDLMGKTLGEAPVEAHAVFDPFNESRDFSLQLKISQFDLTQANAFARAYAKLDFSSGHGDFVMELDAKDGHLRGYAKPLFQDLHVLSWKQDVQQDKDNPLQLAWEAASGLVARLFTNQRADQFATRVEISGEIGSAQTHPLDAILAVLSNAFVQAYKPQFEEIRKDK